MDFKDEISAAISAAVGPNLQTFITTNERDYDNSERIEDTHIDIFLENRAPNLPNLERLK
jgi:hypothetical protein